MINRIWRWAAVGTGLILGAGLPLAAQTNLIQNSGPIGIGTTNPSALLEVANSGASTFRVGVSNNAANTVSQLRSSLAVVDYDLNQVATCGVVAADCYNDGHSPTWAGIYMVYSGLNMTGTYYGLPQSNQGTLLFQNVSNGVIASNGANISISPLGNVDATFLTNGNVGIGTTTPSTLLTLGSNNPTLSLIPNSGAFGRDSSIDMWGTFGYATNGDNAPRRFAQIVAGSDSTGAWDTAHLAFMGVTIDGGSPVELMRINTYTGNVGIGTTDPTNKLEVNGTIRAKEVIVEANNWPDYVFAKGAAQPSLADWQKSIDTKGHLPGIPSAAEAKKGVSLGAVQKALLKKVEQLSLIVIKQQKELEDQRHAMAHQDAEITQLRELVTNNGGTSLSKTESSN